MSENGGVSNLTDVQLARLAASGDNDAFEEIAGRYAGLLECIASGFKVDGFDMNDLMQEALLVLYSVCRTYDEKNGASFKNYLSVCAKRRFISILRRQNSQVKKTAGVVSYESLDNICEREDPRQNPEQRVYDRERFKELLERLQNELSDMERNVLTLRVAGMSYSQIAEKLGISEKSVENALARLRRKLS